MAKPPLAGKCVHCLTENVERNWDHIFADAWYPETTPKDMERWQIPSCLSCNSEYGKLENDLLGRLGLCLDPNHSDTAEIVQKALRAANPKYAKSDRDHAARTARAKKLNNQMRGGKEIPRKNAYPGLEERWGRPETAGVSISLPVESVRRLAQKIVRGICYREDKQFIEPPQVIIVVDPSHDTVADIRATLDASSTNYARKPGFIVRRAVLDDEVATQFFEITIWSIFVIYATVTT
jgi:hypothetical protein